jgi:hypothetical protein
MSRQARSRAAQPDPTPVGLQVHPPERRHRPVIVASPSCCCCCCCCLHTIGGLAGAGMASASPRGRAGTRLYWQTFGVLTGISLFGGLLYAGVVERELYGGVVVTLVLLALGLPFVQLIAALVAAAVVALRPGPPQAVVREIDPIWGPEAPVAQSKADVFGALARITGYTIAGTLLGIVLMGLTCVAFSMRR